MLELQYKVHRAQAAVLQDPHRFVTLVSGRRFGKSSAQLIKLLVKTLQPWTETGIRPSVLGVAPTHPQTRAVLFVPFLDFCREVFGEAFDKTVKVNRTLMTVDFGPSYPLLRFSGAHGNASERLRGLKLLHASVDEAKDVPWSFFNKVLFPALADLNGTGLFTGTPAGRSNTLYKLYANPDPQFNSHNYSSYANTLIPGFREALDDLRRLLPPEDFKTEILGRFTSTAGQYYTAWKKQFHYTGCRGKEPVMTWMVGFDPGPRNRGWVIVAQIPSGFCVVHAERQSEVGLDTAALDQIQQQLHQLRAAHGGKVLFVAVDPSRPELVTHLRRNKTNGIKAVNSFDAGVNITNTLLHQQRLSLSPESWVTGQSQDWFAEQIEDYHRKTTPLGDVIDVEDVDIPTHTLDGLRYVCATLDKLTPNLLGLSSILPSKQYLSV